MKPSSEVRAKLEGQHLQAKEASGKPRPVIKYSKAKAVRTRNDEDHWERKSRKFLWLELILAPFTFFSRS